MQAHCSPALHLIGDAASYVLNEYDLNGGSFRHDVCANDTYFIILFIFNQIYCIYYDLLYLHANG